MPQPCGSLSSYRPHIDFDHYRAIAPPFIPRPCVLPNTCLSGYFGLCQAIALALISPTCVFLDTGLYRVIALTLMSQPCVSPDNYLYRAIAPH